MQNIADETNITKIIKMMGKIFCITIVKRILCVILIAFEVDKNVIAKELNLSIKSIKRLFKNVCLQKDMIKYSQTRGYENARI